MRTFIITSGCYSDYGIRGVGSSRKQAQAAIDAAKAAEEYWATDAGIEEWGVDELLGFRKQRVYSCGVLLDDGSVVEKYEGTDDDHITTFEKPFRGEVTQFNAKVPLYQNRAIVRTRSTVSINHALKLATEKRQEWLRKKRG